MTRVLKDDLPIDLTFIVCLLVALMLHTFAWQSSPTLPFPVRKRDRSRRHAFSYCGPTPQHFNQKHIHSLFVRPPEIIDMDQQSRQPDHKIILSKFYTKLQLTARRCGNAPKIIAPGVAREIQGTRMLLQAPECNKHNHRQHGKKGGPASCRNKRADNVASAALFTCGHAHETADLFAIPDTA